MDEKGRQVRHEVLFATKCTPKLAEGGIHVLIVPQRILADEALARHWTGWYERSLLLRFPDGEFEAFGQVSSASIIIDKMTGRSRGFGFVEMPEKNQGEAAIQALHLKELKGRALTVNEARPKSDRPAGGGGYGGGGGRGGGRRDRW